MCSEMNFGRATGYTGSMAFVALPFANFLMHARVDEYSRGRGNVISGFCNAKSAGSSDDFGNSL